MLKKRMERLLAALLCLLLCAICVGCEEKAQVVPEIPTSASMPPAKAEAGKQSFTASLYFTATDNRKLSVETRKIELQPGMSRVEATLRALLEGPRSQSVQSVVQWGIRFDSVEISDSVCNVFLSGEITLDEKQWLITRAAVASTVFAAAEVSFVNLYYNDMEPGYHGRPLGAIGPIFESLDAYVRNIELEYEALEEERTANNGSTSSEMRNCTLYYLSENERFLTAAGGLISYEGASTIDSIASTLLTRLCTNEDLENLHKPAVPTDLSLQVEPEIVLSPTADAADEPAGADVPLTDLQTMRQPGIVELTIREPDAAFDKELLAASITLTLTGYLPWIEGVRIWIAPEFGEPYLLQGRDSMTRKMFADKIGHTVTFAYPQTDGAAFCSVPWTVGGQEAYDPYARLAAYLEAAPSPGVRAADFTEADLRDVYASGDMMIVDWKEGFADTLRALSAKAEQPLPRERRAWLFVYGVIDTLTEMPGIQRVWMLEDGRKLGMVGDLYLGNALLRNPGVLEDAAGGAQ
ncbi:MAG: GerMN domain-containing protein [Eubacteriales bacterium]|nr:GerMN domain-containing protein [Eubacteriales bacterium]